MGTQCYAVNEVIDLIIGLGTLLGVVLFIAGAATATWFLRLGGTR